MATNTVARAANDLGMGAWFGSALVDAVGLDPLARDGEGQSIIRSAQRRLVPLDLGAWAAAVTGATRLAGQNRSRLGRQAGVARTSAAKTGLMGVASATTILASLLETRERPSPRAVRMLHGVTALVTGGLLLADARLGEQQRPTAVATGMGRRAVQWVTSSRARKNSALARKARNAGR